MFKFCRRNFKIYNFEFECRFCSLICFFVPILYQYGLDPADVDYFILIGNIIIIVQYIQDV